MKCTDEQAREIAGKLVALCELIGDHFAIIRCEDDEVITWKNNEYDWTPWDYWIAVSVICGRRKCGYNSNDHDAWKTFYL